MRSLWMLSLPLVACAPPPPNVTRETFSLEVQASADDQKPVADAQIWLNGELVGTTSKAGRLSHRFVAVLGSPLHIETRCPERYHVAGTGKQLRARRVNGVMVDGAAPLPISVQCTPTHRQALVVIRSDGRSLPVLLDGERIGKTSDKGIAHLLLDVADGHRFAISLDTSAHPRLEPQNPQLAFHVADHDQRFVFDQSFRETPRARKKRRRAPPPPQPEKPTRLESHKKVWKELNR